MARLLKRFRRCEKGVTAVEYGLLIAGISVAIMASLFLLGDNIAATFSTLAASFSD